MGFPTFTPTPIPKRSHFKDLRAKYMYAFIHLFISPTFINCWYCSVGGNIQYVQISREKAEMRCFREHTGSTVILISLIRGGFLPAAVCVVGVVDPGSLPALERLLSPSSTETWVLLNSALLWHIIKLWYRKWHDNTLRTEAEIQDVLTNSCWESASNQSRRWWNNVNERRGRRKIRLALRERAGVWMLALMCRGWCWLFQGADSRQGTWSLSLGVGTLSSPLLPALPLPPQGAQSSSGLCVSWNRKIHTSTVLYHIMAHGKWSFLWGTLHEAADNCLPKSGGENPCLDTPAARWWHALCAMGAVEVCSFQATCLTHESTGASKKASNLFSCLQATTSLMCPEKAQ